MPECLPPLRRGTRKGFPFRHQRGGGRTHLRKLTRCSVRERGGENKQDMQLAGVVMPKCLNERGRKGGKVEHFPPPPPPKEESRLSFFLVSGDLQNFTREAGFFYPLPKKICCWVVDRERERGKERGKHGASERENLNCASWANKPLWSRQWNASRITAWK